MIQDEYGRPFIVMRDGENKGRLQGIEAHKANILAASSICRTLRSSLGPKGMDKILISPDGELTVTNDGATILEKMDVEHQAAKLLVELSKSQDDEIGDGTTGIVVIAGGLLDEALKLLEKGLHPLLIAHGYEIACEAAVKRINEIAKSTMKETTVLEELDQEALHRAAMTSLGSKVVSRHREKMAQLAVDAVLSVATVGGDGNWDVNIDLINSVICEGGSMDECRMISGIVIDKEFSHPQMSKELKDAKMAVLTCPFEPPKPKTKHHIEIDSAEKYAELATMEKKYFQDMVQMVKDSGANVVICQWGFDDEANHLLYQNGLHAVRWVGGVEIELIAIASAARIVPRFEELKTKKLGTCARITEMNVGTSDTSHRSMLFIEGCPNSKAITVLFRGGNKMICEEAQRSLHDAMCVVRNLLRDSYVCPGGGASEIACSMAVEAEADKYPGLEQYVIRAYAEALDVVPVALAESVGLPALSTIADLRAKQHETKKGSHGVDIFCKGETDMYADSLRVHEARASKVNQLRLATQVVKMLLKIDDIIAPQEVFQ